MGDIRYKYKAITTKTRTAFTKLSKEVKFSENVTYAVFSTPGNVFVSITDRGFLVGYIWVQPNCVLCDASFTKHVVLIKELVITLSPKPETKFIRTVLHDFQSWLRAAIRSDGTAIELSSDVKLVNKYVKMGYTPQLIKYKYTPATSHVKFPWDNLVATYTEGRMLCQPFRVDHTRTICVVFGTSNVDTANLDCYLHSTHFLNILGISSLTTYDVYVYFPDSNEDIWRIGLKKEGAIYANILSGKRNIVMGYTESPPIGVMRIYADRAPDRILKTFLSEIQSLDTCAFSQEDRNSLRDIKDSKNIYYRLTYLGMFAGYVHIDTQTQCIVSLAIAPRFQRNGIATHALTQIFASFKQIGEIPTLNLSVRADNTIAQHLCTKLGFLLGAYEFIYTSDDRFHGAFESLTSPKNWTNLQLKTFPSSIEEWNKITRYITSEDYRKKHNVSKSAVYTLYVPNDPAPEGMTRKMQIDVAKTANVYLYGYKLSKQL